MNAQSEFMNDALHVLVQPVSALRTALELGLNDHANQPAARKTFEDCLGLIDRLTQELALLREVASLQPEPPLELCDGQGLLQSCVAEMAPVAEACGVALCIEAEKTEIECNAPTLQRAVFLLLDELIACSPAEGISIRLTRQQSGAELQLHPGTAPGRRQQLFRKLIESAGGRDVDFHSARTRCCFRVGGSLLDGDEIAAD